MSITIGHFLNYARSGGTVDMVESLIKRSKYEHIYVTFQATEERKKSFEERGIECIELGDNNIDGAIKFMRENVDIVQASNSGGPEPGVHIGISANLPTIEVCQSPSYPSGSQYENVYVVPVSNGILHYWPHDIRYDRVIYSCAEPIIIESVDRKEACKKFGLDPMRPVVGRLGRLEGLKRPLDFVEIAIKLHTMMPNVQFLLCGDGSDSQGIHYAVDKAKELSNVNINMPGNLIGVDKIEAYAVMDVFLYPTTMEGFGIVFAEAMSRGLPIVTYNDEVNTDIVGAAGVYGMDNRFYDSIPNPWEHMASLTANLLLNRREYDKMSARGIRRYTDRYTPERLASEYDKLYEDIMSRKGI